MFKFTQTLFEKGKGLLWKKKSWSLTRKYNAKKRKKTMLAVEEQLRAPYFEYKEVKEQGTKSLSENEILRKINGAKRSYRDIVDNYFKNLKNS